MVTTPSKVHRHNHLWSCLLVFGLGNFRIASSLEGSIVYPLLLTCMPANTRDSSSRAIWNLLGYR